MLLARKQSHRLTGWLAVLAGFHPCIHHHRLPHLQLAQPSPTNYGRCVTASSSNHLNSATS